jgi:hypothetical protein
MPYRRLPTTDKARLRALNNALKIASQVSLNKLAFSQHNLEELQLVKSKFENAIKQHEADLKVFNEKLKDYKTNFEKAYLYVSHFIQVVFMMVERGEMKEETLSFYNLDDVVGKIPTLKTEEELLGWGNHIISGEQKRIQSGGSPIYNPSIALVKVNFENFRESTVFQRNLKKNTNRSYNKLKDLRVSTNDFISRLWNQIEDNIQGDNPKHKRQLAQEYGLVYVFRRNEKKKLSSEDLQRDLLFDFG